MIPITASILIILTKTASIHANNGNIINTAIPIAYSGGYPFSISGDIRSVPS